MPEPVGGRDAGRPAGTGRPALCRCIGIDPEHFADNHWGRRPLLTRAESLPKPFDDLLTLDNVDELLSRRGLRTPFLRIARNGTILSTKDFTGPGGVGAGVPDQVLDEQVLRLFSDGCTLVLQGLHRLWPPLIDFATQLREDLGHPVQINAYITPASAQGFSAHYDVHDVFVLQLAGPKRWQIHDPVHPDPLPTHPWQSHRPAVTTRATHPPLLDETLTPGDTLYLPRGYIHSARALGEISAHLTIGIPVLTRHTLVEALCTLAGNNRSLRTSLPLGFDLSNPDTVTTELTATIQALTHTLQTTSPADITRLVRNRIWSGTRPRPLNPLAQASAAHNLKPGTPVRARPGLPHALRLDHNRVLLELPGDELSLPASAHPALVELLAGEPVVVGELPGLDMDEQLVVVRRLLREGVVVPAG